MICSTCHADIPADSAFCPQCGAKLQGVPPAPGAVTTPTDRLRGTAGASPAEPEHELWRGTYSPSAMYGTWLLAALATVGLLAAAILIPNPLVWIAAAVAIPIAWVVPGFALLVRRLSIEYTLTSQRFLHQRGLLKRVANRILLVDIDDVAYEQGLMERFVNVGTITIRSKDDSDPILRLAGIADVQRVTNLIDDARREERRKRAIYMASV